MNFIIQRQEQGAEQLAQAETIINALAKSQLHADKQLEKHDERIARFERFLCLHRDLINRHDTQLVALTDGLNKLDPNRTTLHHGARERRRRPALIEPRMNPAMLFGVWRHSGR
jgi:hypothetical protein